MKTVIISQARMTSTRLPGKVLKQVLNKPLLEYHLDRLQRSRLADDVIIATTINESDEPIVDLCKRLGVGIYRGSEHDVLARYFEAASEYKADTIVRVTSDCPLIDSKVVDEVIAAYVNNNVDYVSNTLERTYPRGMDTEVFSFSALKSAYLEAGTVSEREHVTPFIYRNSERFCIKNYSNKTDESKYRLTVDTLEDFTLISTVLESLYPQKAEFTLADILKLLNDNPYMAMINARVEQKQYGV